MSGTRILLVDDHALFADALRGVLARLGPKTSIECATSAEHAFSLLERGATFELILLDLWLPGVKGRAAFDAIRSAHQTTTQAFDSRAASHQRGLAGSIRITATEIIANAAVTPALGEFRRLYPDVQVDLWAMTTMVNLQLRGYVRIGG